MKIFVKIIVFSFILNVLHISEVFPRAYDKDKDSKQLRSSHFVINYHKDVDYSHVNKIKNTAEKYYTIITQEFNLIRDEFWSWENRAKIFIAKDRDDYKTRFECPPWSGACVDYINKKIYTFPNHQQFESILIHELTHIIFREYVGTGQLPLWLDEGTACYVEDKYAKTKYKNSLFELKKRLKNDKYIKLTDLSNITGTNLKSYPDEDVRFFYLESFSIVNFIITKYGKRKFYNLKQALKKGYSFEEALAKKFYYLKDLDGLEKAWKKFYLK
ncbi:MAG: hypothetical protein KAS51_00900 [Candidatus Omnitrophica bacterium]|nr:hypothetical protein [Candidatus Omnitrophota bacterium]